MRAAAATGARWSTQVGAELDVGGEMRRLALDVLAELLIGWKRHAVSARTRYVRITNQVPYMGMTEVVLYGRR
ncbi:MAG TPA: hypothetical protein VL242_26700 [Sorangium sp.]|nr:hypothetical protein [Sorangium sp.]